MSQTGIAGRFRGVNATGKVMEEITVREAAFDFDGFFESHYQRVARVIARVVRDPARVEELAVDVFWKLRSAVRAGLDELRRQARRGRYEGLLARFSRTKTPEQLHAVGEEKEQVRGVPARLSSRHAELLVLRADGLSYDEMASALRLNPASIGTLLSRAQQVFRKEYVKSYGPTAI